MKCTSVYFTAPGLIELREEALASPKADEVLVETRISAISAGTEMLVYRGQFPRELPDAHDALSGELRYPVCYGYSSVGRVKALGSEVDRSWADRSVFAFQPHKSHYLASTTTLLPLPDSFDEETAIFLPNMETAVNFVQDARPLLGERVLILGQGIVGLLTTGLIHQFPVERVVTADRYLLRRNASLEIGADTSLDPTFEDFHPLALGELSSVAEGFDLTLELSGNPAALDDAIALTMFSGRIVIGSWYGEKRAPIDLGGKYHRSRIEIVSSQVSSISPTLSGRWSKARRFEVAWQALERLHPERYITQRFGLGEAAEAYRLIDQSPEQTIQVVLTYT